MKCPQCASVLSDVLETRTVAEGVRRRRQCYNGHRYTTLEVLAVIEYTPTFPSHRKAVKVKPKHADS